MEIVKTAGELKNLLDTARNGNKTVGFVPTMGALHAGHLSLVAQAKAQSDLVVVSIFVNPTQFNNLADLKTYPRTPEQDLKMLKDAGCQIVFMPEEEEMYPQADNREFIFGELDTIMEGAHRPGHFSGVAKIVSKLFTIINADKAFFGLKDFQQVAVVKMLVANYMPEIKTQIVACETLREPDGLAMSSRNRLLTRETRKAAPIIAETMIKGRNLLRTHSVKAIEKFVSDSINRNPYLKVEYFSIVNSDTLMPVADFSGDHRISACIAVQAGNVRLIDNMYYR